MLASYLASATWPLGAVLALTADKLSPPSTAPASSSKGRPHATLGEHLGMQIACIPRLLLVLLVWRSMEGWESYAQVLQWSWVLPIVLRDWLLLWAVGGITDFLHLSEASPFRASMQRHKYQPEDYPLLWSRRRTSAVAHDIFWSTVSATVAALMEVAVLHGCATGRLSFHAGTWWRHWPTVVLMLSWFYSQNVQFYCLHRCLHAWGTSPIDPGAFLYKWVHSLHHQSKNTTAFSGISMHPVESALYFSYALLPVALGASPVAFLYIKSNLIAAALLGHSGFEAPASGSQSHWLHHALVHVNYAENHLPLDWLFGTFAADEEEAMKSMQSRRLKAA